MAPSDGLGRYTVVVLLVAVLCGGVCVYSVFDTNDPFAPWFAAVTGVFFVGTGCYGWALASLWWFGVKGVHPKWSLLKSSDPSK